MSDNWTLSDNMKVHFLDGNGATATIAGRAPGTHDFYLQLEDEAGNKSARMSVTDPYCRHPSTDSYSQNSRS